MTKSKSQIDKFRETARALETDEDEAKFNAALQKVAKGDPKALDEMADKLGQTDPNKNFGKKH
jgi:hypothetical protein